MTQKVSIILTSYNHDQFIRDSIESMLNQSYPHFELFILDDHSTDESWSIIQSYRDSRIHTYQNATNFGTCYIKDAFGDFPLGDYIAIHHSDDVWEQNKLEKQVSLLENHPQYAAVFSHAKIINDKGKDYSNTHNFYYDIFNQPNRSRHEWLRYFFMKGNVLCNPSAMIRKHQFLDLITHKGLYQLSDMSLWVQLCLLYEIHVIQEKLVRFRVHDDAANMSGNRPDTRMRHRFEITRILEFYKQINSTEDLLAIFPEAQFYLHQKNKDILYALGKVAVKISPEKTIQLFGLNLLYDALNDDTRARKLEKYQQFNLKEFVKLTGNIDIFSNEMINSLTQELDKRKERESFYSQSRSWRFTKPLRDLMSLWRKAIKKK